MLGHESIISPCKQLRLLWSMRAAFPKAHGDPSWSCQLKWEVTGWKTATDAWCQTLGLAITTEHQEETTGKQPTLLRGAGGKQAEEGQQNLVEAQPQGHSTSSPAKLLRP